MANDAGAVHHGDRADAREPRLCRCETRRPIAIGRGRTADAPAVACKQASPAANVSARNDEMIRARFSARDSAMRNASARDQRRSVALSPAITSRTLNVRAPIANFRNESWLLGS
jgi:hypothetical protein